MIGGKTMQWLILPGLFGAFSVAVSAQAVQHPSFGPGKWPQALRMADFILSLQEPGGAIADQPEAETANQDSNMEYALIALGAAYAATGNEKYLTGLERGIQWLAAREEMADPAWKGSWYYVYSTVPPYARVPTSPGPGITDVRGVDATSALFVYLLSLHKRLTGSAALAQTYSANARAALDFVISHNLDTDGFSWSSYHLFASDARWHLYRMKYSADQGDVYLGMQAGAILYNPDRYGPVARFLRSQVPLLFFSSSQQRYGLGIDGNKHLETSLDGNNEAFAQGYLSWMWGDTTQNRVAISWLRSKAHADGSIVTKPGARAYSLSAAMLGMGDYALGQPAPLRSLQWLTTQPYDAASGGVHDTSHPGTSKYANVTGFCTLSLLGFLPF